MADRVSTYSGYAGVCSFIIENPIPDFTVGESHGQADNSSYEPSGKDDNPAVVFRPQGHGLDGVHHGQESVQGHKHQSVDANVGRGYNQVLYALAPEKLMENQ